MIEVMNNSLLILSVFIFSFNTGLIAQNESEGVYLSANNYTIGKVSYSNNCPGRKHQLCLNEFSNSSSISIKIGDSVITLAKDAIFGFRDKQGKNYRFYKKSVFEILNPAEQILLYKNSLEVGSPKSKTLVINYYFSENAASPIYPLTKHNLGIVFGNDVHFMELLNMYFHFDNELTVYDSLHKVYFLNCVFKESNLESEERRNKLNEYESKCSIFYN